MAPPRDPFPYKKHRITGFIQIGLGLSAIVLQICDVVLINYYQSKFVTYLETRGPSTSYKERRYILWNDNTIIYKLSSDEHQFVISHDATFVVFGWTGLMFILAGAFGAAMTEKRKDKIRCLRNTYIALSILVAAISALTLLIAACVELGMAAWSRSGVTEGRKVFPALILLVAIAELIVSIVAASIGCWCSPIVRPVPLIQTTGVTPVGYGYSPQPQPQSFEQRPQPYGQSGQENVTPYYDKPQPSTAQQQSKQEPPPSYQSVAGGQQPSAPPDAEYGIGKQ